ncbi:MAG TPA: hypothetical protein EYQ12_08290, partial [Oceanospirillaceae bacterium]|nr:hypothetical protein [Oceanospirillaceae bacterium]
AFVLCSVLITLVGLSGWFDRLMSCLPKSIAAAMLAGVLLPFAMHMLIAMESEMALVLGMMLAYFVSRIIWPRIAVMITLILGMVLAGTQDLIIWQDVSLGFTTPIWTTPEWSLTSTIGVAIPLFIVTMASQNVPGLVVLRSHGYDAP